jgi:sterol-4alpha-carboxylate 3-dehydrogenase (decarboxylating)
MSGSKVVVTGGAGFLGGFLIEQLLKGGAEIDVAEVRVLDRRPVRHPDPRVRSTVGDLGRYEQVVSACRGADIVFHTAAIVDWGRVPDSELELVNVGGTRNVIRACIDAGVGSLVHTSTLDVVYTGRPVVDGDETLPLADGHSDGYTRTKAEAERLVVAANGTELASGSGELRTAVIRPTSIYGEGDPFHIPPLLRMSRHLPMIRIGRGTAVTNFVYAGNVAHAHVLAGRALLARDPRVSGQVYFVTDSEPRNFFDFFEPVIRGAGHGIMPRALAIPRPVMCGVAAAVEGATRLARPIVRLTPTVTRFAVDFLCLDFSFRSDKAARDLGYRPIFTEQEAMERTVAWFREHPVC